MDPKVMEFRIKQWIPVFEEQAKSGLNKDEWCIINGINRGSFFRWQKRVRSYLLEHGEIADPAQVSVQVPAVNEKTDTGCFVELSCSQPPGPGISALKNLPDDYPEEDAPISIHYGAFSVNVNGDVDERQLTAVLRAMKNAD